MENISEIESNNKQLEVCANCEKVHIEGQLIECAICYDSHMILRECTVCNYLVCWDCVLNLQQIQVHVDGDMSLFNLSCVQCKERAEFRSVKKHTVAAKNYPDIKNQLALESKLQDALEMIAKLEAKNQELEKRVEFLDREYNYYKPHSQVLEDHVEKLKNALTESYDHTDTERIKNFKKKACIKPCGDIEIVYI